MEKKWVSFDQIKKFPGVMTKVLDFYGLLDDMKDRGAQLYGICPIHKGTNRSEFSVNREKSIFQCFSCKAKGDVISFVEAMENVERREAALKIASWLDIVPEDKKLVRGKEKIKGNRSDESKEAKKEIINPPLKFHLQNLDTNHPYLNKRILSETISHFGLGLCKTGIMKDRIVIPIHNEKGELIAYAGRWPGDPPENESKYKLPPKFQKSHMVFNLHRAKEFIYENGLILVEGYFSVFKLFQAGFPNAVALMGSQLSQYQEELILKTIGANGKIILLFDNDEAGIDCQKDVLQRLGKQCFVRVVELPEGIKQLDPMKDHEIKDLLSSVL